MKTANRYRPIHDKTAMKVAKNCANLLQRFKMT